MPLPVGMGIFLKEPQRAFLEALFCGLEVAGYPPNHCPRSLGLFANEAALSELPWAPAAHREATRESLMAVERACSSLLSGDCDLALAGGAELQVSLDDGWCPAADQAAGMPSAAALVLKRLDEAIAAGDTIRAILTVLPSPADDSPTGNPVASLPAVAGVAILIGLVEEMAAAQGSPSDRFAQSGAIEVRHEEATARFLVHPRHGMGPNFALEGPPEAIAGSAATGSYLLAISASTAASLAAATRSLRSDMERLDDGDLADVAYTLLTGRSLLPHRQSWVVAHREEALAALAPGAHHLHSEPVTSAPPVAFLLPGGGNQHPQMGRRLYESVPRFRQEIDQASDFLGQSAGFDLLSVLYPGPGKEAKAAQHLRRPSIALPALAATELALARTWMSWGVRPTAMIGHSLGEYVAACLAGVFRPQDLLALCVLRGRLHEELPAGAMITVPLPEAEAEALLGGSLSLTAVNSPRLCLAGGNEDDVEALAVRLKERGLEFRRLAIRGVSHSPLVEPMLDELRRFLAGCELSAPRIPYVSNVTGRWIRDQQATDPNYWATHLSHTVRFADGVQELLRHPQAFFLEVGPGRTLSTLTRQQAAPERVIVRSMRHPREEADDRSLLLEAAGELWRGGVPLLGKALFEGEQRRRLALFTPPGLFGSQAPSALEETDGDEESRVESAVEGRLAELWCEVLEVASVARDDDFFARGGHSLAATRLLARIEQTFRVKISLPTFFNRATISGLAAHLEEAGTAGSEDGGIAPQPRDGVHLPLSFAQQRLWLIDQLEPQNPFYNNAFAFRIHGALDPAALAASLAEMVRRHEALRTIFLKDSGGEPWQRALAAPQAELPQIDLRRAVGRGRPRPTPEALGRALVRRPFWLERGPLWRPYLLRWTDEVWMLLVVVHHIVFDRWSLGVFQRELTALYPAMAAGQPHGLAELSIQYADFAIWQRERLSGPVLSNQLAWWRAQLAGVEPLELPTDRPRPRRQSFDGARLPVALGAELSQRFEAWCRQHSVTPFMALLAVLGLLLRRLSGQREVTVGSPIAGRPRRETEDLIGFFVNTLVLRLGGAGESSIAGWLADTRNLLLGAYAHQEIPFEKLVQELLVQESELERDLGRNALVEVMFALQNVPVKDLTLGDDLVLEPMDVFGGTAKTDLILFLWQREEGLSGFFEYNTGLFDATTVQRFAGHLRHLVASLLDHPNCLREITLLAPAERHALLVESNDTASTYERDASITGLFARQVDRCADAVALVCGDLSISYCELDRRSSDLAGHFSERGVGCDTLVGLHLKRSLEMVVALVAILKAGGAYVALDPDYPSERIELMVADAGIRHVVHRGGEAPAGTVGFDVATPVVRGRAGQLAVGMPEGLAYVSYTSGSTGVPKGVAICQRSVVRLVRHTNYARLADDETFLLLAPLSFDASTLEIWGPLLSGGRLVVAPPGAPTLLELGEILLRHGITTLWLTAGLFHLMADERPQDLVRLRQLLAGGDVLSPERVKKVLDLGPDLVLINGYGPTENTTFTTCHRMASRGDVGPAVSIGRPIAATRVHVADRDLASVPLGVAGELFAAGDGLARGYLNRPALTAAKFLPDPTNRSVGGRLYRTGDAVRWRTDGRLDFLGRVDQQVKVRGFRIEPGEVEKILETHPAVERCAVLARPVAQGEKVLVAFVVPGEGTMEDQELRRRLAEVLPAFMVPSVFVHLPSLPLNANGKVDRRRLHEIEVETAGSGGDSAEEMVAPSGEVEELLAEIWEDLLGIERVGVHDDFFELGGHSLLATRLLSQFHKRTGVQLALRQLFETPTIAALAATLGELPVLPVGGESVPAARAASLPGPAPLSFAQQRLWLLYRMAPHNPAYNLPLRLRLRGPLEFCALGAALTALAARQDVLRTTFREQDGVAVQVVMPPAELPCPLVDLAHLGPGRAVQTARQLAAEEAVQPFDLEAGPAVRVHLLRLAEKDHLLVANLHHIISDGWSQELFAQELAALYSFFAQGQEHATGLSSLALRYAEHAAAERRRLGEEALADQLAYWQAKLVDVPPLLELPTDYPRPVRQGFRGAAVDFQLSAALQEALTAVGQRHGGTLFLVLLSGFYAFLGRLTHRRHIVLGTPVAGRHKAEVEHLLGFFVNTLALPVDLGGDPTFGELLRATREALLDAHAHQDVPFERLVEVLDPQRSTSHAPIFQISFSLHTRRQPAPFFGLETSWATVDFAASKLDLALMITETEKGLEGSLRYDRELFAATTIERWARQLTLLLGHAAKSFGERLSRLDLITPGERHQVLHGWNDTAGTASAADHGTAVHHLFARQAWERPEAVAVVDAAGAEITYAELARRAQRLAATLCRRGAGRETVVAIALERSIEMITAFLAVIKAGAAYLPLDLNVPAERLAFQLRDAAGSHSLLAVGDRGSKGLLPQGVPWVEATAGEDSLPATLEISPAQLAYVIYTSGSTGRPKGVEVPHGGLANLVAWYRRTFVPRPGERMTQFSTPAFDAATFEIWPALTSGASLYLAPEEARTSAPALLDWLAAERIDLCWLPTPLAEAALREPSWPLQRPRVIQTAGDRLHGTALPEPLPVPLFNLYGPTEGTVMATWARVRPHQGDPPIGRPMNQVKVHVVGRRLEVVPLGVAGELWITGRGVARGYGGRPALTAASFVPDPLAAEDGARAYRSGDLVRWRGDGALEFLGRIDHQVKVRGFRIELAEIEAVLGEHAAVREAAVLTRPAAGGEERLVAYVVLDGADHGEELVRHLEQRLPSYMVPSAFVELAALPLTANGKLDRKALPVAQAGEVSEQRLRTPQEEIISVIWCEILAVEEVGLEDDFFELGGHSLLATRTRDRLQAAFGIELPLLVLFEATTVAALAARVVEAMGGEPLPAIKALVRRDGVPEHPVPLSFAQERLWFLDRLASDQPFYNVAASWRLRGPLKSAALASAMGEIVARHEVLRTSFPEAGGRPWQRIAAVGEGGGSEWQVRQLDLAPLAEEERAQRLAQVADEERLYSFDLARGPLLRTLLVKLRDDEQVLFVVFHHTVADGGSLAVLLAELKALYEAALGGRPAALDELPVQYAEFTAWQREALAATYSAQLDWWRHQLAGAPALELATDRPRPAVQSYGGRELRFTVAAGSVKRLERTGRAAGATLFMALLAGYQALLQRLTGQFDVVVGTPVANRPRTEVAGLIGCFMNTLALRGRRAAETAWGAYLQDVATTALGAYAHQDLPFEKLVEELHPKRDLSRSPLFQTLFLFQRTTDHESAFGEVEVTLQPFEIRHSRVDLELHLWQRRDGGLDGVWVYNPELFDRTTVARFVEPLRSILAAEAATPLGEVEVLSPAARQQLVAEWGYGRPVVPGGFSLTALLVPQLEGRGEETALVCGDARLSYAELDRRSRHLAYHLLALGVKAEEPVALLVERSFDLVVGLLGILRSGAAYLPLDPIYPPKRLAHMLADSGARFVLSRQELASLLPQTVAGWVDLGALPSRDSAAPAVPLAIDLDRQRLAYVLYTSGSTGRPKGVLVSHGAAVRFLTAMAEDLGTGSEDTLLAVTTVSFDIALLELFLPLVTGACVVLARREETVDGRRLGQRIDEVGATVVQATPSTWRLLLDAGWRGAPHALTALCGGEALSADLAAALAATGVRLWNVYGPTETTVWSTSERLSMAGAVSIGRPLAGETAFVLGRDLRPVPLGAVGQLWIGGVGVARGYLGRRRLTAERFRPAPFGPAGARIYGTGDLGRFLADGRLECLGRLDHQVKLRGFRIELGEIESAIADALEVSAVVAGVRDGAHGAPRLVAWLVLARGAALDEADLRQRLRDRLPEYMVPASFLVLDALPQTPNGKVDRRALPAPASAPRVASSPAVPATPVGRTLAEIWRQVLEVEKVGLDDNFFDLGGHSLLLARVQSRIRQELGEELEMVDLFRYPTLAGLAQRLAPAETVSAGTMPSSYRPPRIQNTEPLAEKEPIAIVAMNGRFPGARTVEELWQNLCNGQESVSFFSDDELESSIYSPEDPTDPRVVKARGVLDGVEDFDATFFGYTPREAAVMDPQQRLFLECAWEAVEQAGYDATRYPGRIGVFAGVGMSTYQSVHLASNPALLRSLGPYAVTLANDKDYLPTRVSYKLDLRGPSLNVQTACSTSLVAVHLACRSLRDGECDMALAGGASIRLPQKTAFLHEPGMILSPDGHCRPFEERARGTVGGNGVALVMLKRLKDAIADGDEITAVLRGSAINNDGAQKMGFTAPSVAGQSEVIRAALADAGVGAETIGYVETHGTGTELGDPIEIEALSEAFRSHTDQQGFCALSALKGNLGHMDTAAGVAGLIKAALAVRHGQIPPVVHFERPNPAIDFASSPFFVAAALRTWEAGDAPRRAGVSSFGIGGTNVHVIVEQAPAVEESRAPRRAPQPLLLSARTPTALDQASHNLAQYLERHSDLPLADVAYTLSVGRKAFEHRRALVATNLEEAVSALASGRGHDDQATEGARRVVFLFPGQGAQYSGMGRELYDHEPVFRREIDRAAELLAPHLGRDLRDVLYPSPAHQERPDGAPGGEELGRTEFTQPALFAVELALARLFASWGVEPVAMIGHSIGEYVAACLAGVWTAEEALLLVAERGRLVAQMAPGAMLSVSLPASEAQALLTADLDLAAANGPHLSTISGPGEAISSLAERLTAEGVEHRLLHTSHAFHSSMMEPALEAFQRRLEATAPQAPQLPFVSNLTGTWITAEEATDPQYWVRHLRHTVLFAAGMAALYKLEDALFLEVGPGRTLGTLARRIHSAEEVGTPLRVFQSLPHPRDGVRADDSVLRAVGRMWAAGVDFDWQEVHGAGRRRLPLPTYPFERRRHWIEARPWDARQFEGGLELPSEVVSETAGREEIAYQDEVEATLAKLWQELLGIARVAPRDDFFELGGHSLLATRLFARVREALAVELPLASLFEAPTLEQQAALVRERRGQGEVAVGELPTLVADPEHWFDPFPLTDVQQAYWTGRSGALELGEVSCYVYCELEFPELDLGRFERAWQRVIERHPMLRAIVTADGQQRVLAEVPRYEMAVQDLRQTANQETEEALAARRAEMSHQVLPSDRWPLFDVRASLLLDSVRIHFGFDLLIGDGWSFVVLGRELNRFYLQPESAVEAIPMTYRDYVLAEHKLQEGELFARSLAYWRERLKDLPPAPELPMVQDPEQVAKPQFRRRSERLDAKRWQRLRERAASFGITPSALVATAFAEVLAAWSKEPRFALTLTLFNRLPLHPQVDELIGDFTSLTLLAIDASGRAHFEARARRLQEQLWRDLDHRYVGGVRVLRELARLEGGQARTSIPVVFTSLLGQEAAAGDGERLGSRAEVVYSISQTPQVWLDHQAGEDNGCLVFNWDAVEELFPAGLMDEMFAAYCALLHRLADGVDAWQQEGRPLVPAAQLACIAEINATAAALPSGLLHQPFLRCAAADSSRLAVVDAHCRLSYGELAALARSIGVTLRRHGAVPNQLVAVVMEKGWEQVAGVLGVLVAGAAYLPIDPSLPEERVRHLLAVGEVRCVLTQPWLTERLNWPEGLEILPLSTDVFAADPGELAAVQSAEDLAYVIFTSGSTGLPKGVMIDHRGALNTVVDVNQRFAVGPEDRVLGLSSLSFDLSVWDVFGILGAGGALVLPEETARREPARWVELLAAERVTVWNTVPALMEMLVEHCEGRSLEDKDLRLVMMSGDWIPVPLPGRLRKAFPGAELVSLGGATEASIWSILHPIERVEETWTSIPYGRPMVNQSVHVFDDDLEPRPFLVPGELYIGGIGVALGYWRDEEKTRASFLTHPRSGERLYRTGDLGCCLADGTIEFLGREDFQVKVQGYRIELGEIEAAMLKHPAVAAAAVNAVGAARGNKRLVGYAVSAVGETLEVEELRQLLVCQLPSYMVPPAMVVIDALPLTANGKVDRKALPEPEVPAEATRAATTPVAEILNGIWAQVLAVPSLHDDDDFYKMGGDSLLGTRIVSRVREALGVDLPLRALFEAPTLGGMAKAVAELRREGREGSELPLVALPRGGDLPLSFAQQRLWFLDQLENQSAFYNVIQVVRLTGALNLAAFQAACQQIVDRHEVLRTHFPATDGEPVQVISPVLELAVPVIDLKGLDLAAREPRARELATAAARRSFDLRHGPLLRVTLLALGEDVHVMVLILHHIISDAWSAAIFGGELATFYRAHSTGEAPHLAPLSVQYADFAHAQRQWLTGEALAPLLDYWRRRLAGAPALELPTDRPAPELPGYRGGELHLKIDAELLGKLRALSREQGTTLFMTLLAAFTSLLHRVTGQQDLVLGTDVAGREHSELERMIGFFVNILVLRLHVDGQPTFRQLLARVRETVLDAYAHQQLPFDKLIEELRPERTLGRTPLVRALFVVENVPAPTLDFPGLALERLEIDDGSARFDLAVFVREVGEELLTSVRYSSDLFEPATLSHLMHQFRALLASLAEDPDAQIRKLSLLTEQERRQQAMKKAKRSSSKFDKFMKAAPRPAGLDQKELVTYRRLDAGRAMPLVIEPKVGDFDAFSWAESHQQLLEEKLRAHGAILCRGFGLETPSDFERFARVVCPTLYGDYGDLPKEESGEKIYHSTPYPPDKSILFHNESSHMHRWPMKQMFFCAQVAPKGGETPIVDCRELYSAMSPALLEKLRRLGLSYVRNFTPGIDVGWQHFFKTDDRAEVEEFCRKAAFEFEWKDDDGLKISQQAPAIARHPKTGELVFFNQIELHHTSFLDAEIRQSLYETVGEEGLPRQVYFGDGSPIPPEAIEEIRGAYDRCAVVFPWQQGDVVVVDNMLVAHARNPYEGPRKIVVAMGEMFDSHKLEAVA